MPDPARLISSLCPATLQLGRIYLGSNLTHDLCFGSSPHIPEVTLQRWTLPHHPSPKPQGCTEQLLLWEDAGQIIRCPISHSGCAVEALE